MAVKLFLVLFQLALFGVRFRVPIEAIEKNIDRNVYIF